MITKSADDVFTWPFPNIHSYCGSLQDCKEGLLALLDSFPAIFAQNTDSGNLFNEAFKLSLEMTRGTGGKLVIIQGNDEFFEETDKEEPSRIFSSNYYACLSKELIKLHISVSIFCHSKCFKVRN